MYVKVRFRHCASDRLNLTLIKNQTLFSSLLVLKSALVKFSFCSESYVKSNCQKKLNSYLLIRLETGGVVSSVAANHKKTFDDRRKLELK